MQIAILAGGKATRLGSLAATQPKSMIDAGGRPFLAYQLDILREAGVTDVVLCVGHLGQQIERQFGDGRDHGVTIRYSFEETPLGTAGALRHARTLLQDVFFTMYGDSYLSVDFSEVARYFESKNKPALMTVYKNDDHYDRSNAVVVGGAVERYSKSQRTEDMIHIDYGVNLFRKDVLDMIPLDSFYSLEDLFPRLIASNALLAYEVAERFYEIGSIHGLQEFRELVENKK